MPSHVPVAVQEALNQSISSGRFVDTKIVLYSRRDASGAVCRPRALYANSHVLKSVPYFGDREFYSRLKYTARELICLKYCRELSRRQS